MNKYELIEKVYFNMKREGLQPEKIVQVNEKYNKGIETIVEQFSDKIASYNGNPISQEQRNFARDATCIMYNELLDQTKTVIVPAKPGFGKSVLIKIAVKKIVEDSLKFGLHKGAIIVSDKYNNLSEYKKAFGDLAYLMDRRYGEPMSVQLDAQRKYPIVIITSTLFKILGENLAVFKTFIHPDYEVVCERKLLIIDEKPLLLDSERIDQKFIGDIKSSIDTFPVAGFKRQEEKEVLRNLLHEVDTHFQGMIDKYQKKTFFVHRPEGQITSDDASLFALIKNLDFDIQNKMMHIKRLMLDEGGLWYNKSYNFTNQQFFRTLGLHNYSDDFKTIIFDGTADIDLEYCDLDKYVVLNIENKTRYKHVSLFNYSELNFSRGTLVEHRGNNKTVKCFVEWMNNKFADKECKIYLTTFKDATQGLTKLLEEEKYANLAKKIVLYDNQKVPSYGATKGQNKWQDCDVAIMFGKYIQSEDVYTSGMLSHFWYELFTDKEPERIAELFNFTDGKYDADRLNFFRLTKIMVDLEQDLFRCAIRNYNDTKPIEIYTFGLDKTGTMHYDHDMGMEYWTDLLGRLRTRLKGCNAVNILEVPQELDKVLNYGDGNTTIAQLIRWVKEYDGTPIAVNKFREQYKLSDDYWKKLFRKNPPRSSISKFQEIWYSKNIQRKANKKFGKGKWIYIEK